MRHYPIHFPQLSIIRDSASPQKRTLYLAPVLIQLKKRRYLTMKLRFVILAIVAFVVLVGFNLLAPGTASAQTRAASTQMTDDCAQSPTIDSLETCVKHAADHGFITSKRVVRSLLAKLD